MKTMKKLSETMKKSVGRMLHGVFLSEKVEHIKGAGGDIP